MAEVELHTTCSARIARAPAHCSSERRRLHRNRMIEEPARRDEMVRRAGGRTTVPQIFIDGEHIGGSDELVALDAPANSMPSSGAE